MADPRLTLESRLGAAIEAALGPEFAGADPVVRRSDRADYQANAAMALAKRAERKPRDVADAVVAALDLHGVAAGVEVAGPGFLNIHLTEDYLARELADSAADARLGVRPATEAETVVVDYSSPNVAREMHVGHLRSTVIGDSIVRLLGFLDHDVIRHNHLGDWGTQFGMLIEYLVDEGWERGGEHHIGDLNALYQDANRRFADDPGFAERARRRVVLLQSGDEVTLALWRDLVEESERHFEAVYELLGVQLTRDDVKPESFYNPTLDEVAAELEGKGLARVDEGALCAFPPGFDIPLIIRKSDGGYGYQATDLAAVRYRTQELGARLLVYAVDARQTQHLSMAFAVAEQAGWLGDGRRAEHVAFGTILGPDGRPFRTRAGGTVKLSSLLEEAVQRAEAVVAEKSPDLDPEAKARVARAVGIGAVKYADLSNDRVKDYIFDWDRMLSFDGNTAPYLQYAHARICSIFRRAEGYERDAGSGHGFLLAEPAERALALQILSFDSAVQDAASTLQPHRLCGYLFELAQRFTDFYESCPVLRADSEDVRRSRLALSDLTARVLRQGLDLLGIDAPERM